MATIHISAAEAVRDFATLLGHRLGKTREQVGSAGAIAIWAVAAYSLTALVT